MKKSKFLIAVIILISVFFLVSKNHVQYTQEVNGIPNKREELFEDYYEKATEIMQSMTLDEKVGQMFYVRYPLNADEEILKDNPGGYILFARDFKKETKDSILKKLKKNQENSKIKMFFGVDEEGGNVVRVSKFAQFRETPFSSPYSLFKDGSFSKVLGELEEKIELLKSIGINTNFAPVVDIPTKETSYIYKRSFGLNLDETIEYTRLVIDKMNDNGMISILKHFPGYGDNVDTHTGIAVDERPLEHFKNYDFKPFIAGIESKAPVILVNHNIIYNIDKKYPASISKKVHSILRNELRFTGLIITDDLDMEAVKEYSSDYSVAVQAVLSGNDMILSSNFANQKQEVLTAIKSGIIEESTINEAVRRIIACKLAYKII